MNTRRLYWLTALFGLIGFVSYFFVAGLRPALGFGLGSLGSYGNLAVFDWLARGLAPGERQRKPWQAGAFATRYLLLFTAGYVIVKALSISPLAVILGLLSSTAAAIVWSAVELFGSRFGTRAN